jgi:hypothetical protein
MFVKVGIALISPFVLIAILLSATGVMLVDVREQGPDGTHLTIPVPLLLAQTALTFAPDEARYVECPEFARFQGVAEKILQELKDTPDFVMVEVEERDQWVQVRKEGDALKILVKEGDQESVEVNLPLSAARRIVDAYDGHGFPTKAAIWALRKAPMGTLVHVKDHGDEVRIRRL